MWERVSGLHSSLWLNNLPQCGYHLLLIHSSVSGDVWGVYCLLIMNNATMSTCAPVYISLGSIPGNGVTGTCASSMCNVLRN